MKRLALAAIAFLLLTFPAVLLASVFSFGCCVVPCHSMQSPTVPMCGAAPTQNVAKVMPQQQALTIETVIEPPSANVEPLVHRATAAEHDVGLHILLSTLII